MGIQKEHLNLHYNDKLPVIGNIQWWGVFLCFYFLFVFESDADISSALYTVAYPTGTCQFLAPNSVSVLAIPQRTWGRLQCRIITAAFAEAGQWLSLIALWQYRTATQAKVSCFFYKDNGGGLGVLLNKPISLALALRAICGCRVARDSSRPRLLLVCRIQHIILCLIN